jgi:Asp/Glu/hydantoin racemase
MKQIRLMQITAQSYTAEGMEYLRKHVASITPPHITVDVVDLRGPLLPPDFKVHGWVTPSYDLKRIAGLAPLFIARAEEAERKGYDAVVISCVWEPGLEAIKAAVDIPVIGMTESLYRVAALLGDRWGVITGLARFKAHVVKRIQALGVWPNIVAVKTLNYDPYLEFKVKKAEVEARFIELSRQLLDEGADLIINVCSPLFPMIGADALERVRKTLGVIVMDPQEVMMSMAEMRVNLGKNYVASRICYPRPFEFAPDVYKFPGKEYVHSFPE